MGNNKGDFLVFNLANLFLLPLHSLVEQCSLCVVMLFHQSYLRLALAIPIGNDIGDPQGYFCTLEGTVSPCMDWGIS